MFKKLLGIFAVLAGLLVLSGVLFSTSATVVDSCGQSFTYEKTSDFSDTRVDINYENGDHQIDVSAQSGYAVTDVELDVDDDGFSGYHEAQDQLFL